MNPDQIIEYIETYNINTIKSPKGYCYGLASMASNAFLLGSAEYQRYRNRLDYMSQDDFLTQMKAFIKEAQLLNEGYIKISSFSAEKLKQWPVLVAYAAISLEKPENKINTDDLYSIYLETRAFLETMTILFLPMFHHELFAKKEYIPQGDDKTVLPLMTSFLAEKQGGVCQAKKFTGLYSYEKMIDYLKDISSVITEKRVALMLSSIDHTISLLYERVKKQWVLDDEGYKSTYAHSENGLAELSKALEESLANDKKNYPVSTSVYSLNHDQKEVTQAFSHLCKIEKLVNNDATDQETTDLIHLAALQGDTEVVSTLLHYPQCNPNQQEKDGFTAIHMAVQNNHMDVINALLAHPECNPNQQNNDGFTPLHLAVQNNRMDVINALLAHPECNPNQQNNDGFTPLHLAAMSGHVEMLKALLEYPQTDLNKKNIDNDTALHLAVHNNHLDVVNALLMHPQCNPNQQDEDGFTALHLAVHNKHLNMVKALLKKGSKVDDSIIASAKSYLNTDGDSDKCTKEIYVYLLNSLPSLQSKKTNINNSQFFKLVFSDINSQFRKKLFPEKKQSVLCSITQARQILLEITDLARSKKYAEIFKVLNSTHIFDLMKLLSKPFANPKPLSEMDNTLIELNKHYITILTRLSMENIVINDNNNQPLPLANFIAQLIRSPAHNNSLFKRAIGSYGINQRYSYYKMVLNKYHYQNVLPEFGELLTILNHKTSLFTKKNTLNKINHALQHFIINRAYATNEKDITAEIPTFEELYQSLSSTNTAPQSRNMP